MEGTTPLQLAHCPAPSFVTPDEMNIKRERKDPRSVGIRPVPVDDYDALVPVGRRSGIGPDGNCGFRECESCNLHT